MGTSNKMTKEQWDQARNKWETDERTGHKWLIPALNLPVSLPAIREYAKNHGWKKKPIKPSKKIIDSVLGANKGEKRSKEVEKSVGIEQAPVDELVNRFDLTVQQALHAREFMLDFNPIQSARRAGYSDDTAKTKGSAMVSKLPMQAAIAYQMRDRLDRMGTDADELVKFHLAIIDFDPNDVCELRIHACRHCWGVDHAQQHIPSSWQREREKFQKRWEKLSESEQKVLGDFPAIPPDGWYEAKRGPNDDCPECHGVGIEVAKWKDTRHMTPMVRRLFSGVKMNKEGLEIVMLQKSASLNTISNHLGLNKVAEAVTNVAIVTETAGKFEEIMARARARQQQVLIDRGIVKADDVIDAPSTDG